MESNNYNEKPLHDAASSGDINSVESFLEDGVDM